jgi:hypothetical protein
MGAGSLGQVRAVRKPSAARSSLSCYTQPVDHATLEDSWRPLGAPSQLPLCPGQGHFLPWGRAVPFSLPAPDAPAPASQGPTNPEAGYPTAQLRDHFNWVNGSTHGGQLLYAWGIGDRDRFFQTWGWILLRVSVLILFSKAPPFTSNISDAHGTLVHILNFIHQLQI